MSKTGTIQDMNLILETQELIVSAIRKDFGNKSIQLASFELPVIEEQDPLGMAFYTYAILETGYLSQDLASKPDTWSQWAEIRLDNGFLTPYIDTEISALGLVLFTLYHHQKLPANSQKYITLVERHFDETKGIYNNFMTTVLAGLGVSVIDVKHSLFEDLQNYINSNLNNNRKDIFNDPKNFVVSYWWSKHTANNHLRESIRNECSNKFKQDEYLIRDICYIAYVLFEEIKHFSRTERKYIKSAVEKSILFIRNYTLEKDADASKEITEQYGLDIAIANSYVQDLYGYPSKPRLSRILLSIGLLIEQKYVNEPYLFDGTEQILARSTGVIAYVVAFFIPSILMFKIWQEVNTNIAIKTNFTSGETSLIALAVLQILLVSGLLCLAISLLTMALTVPYNLIKNVQIRHSEALLNSWNFVKKWALTPEMAAAIAINLYTNLF